MRRARPVIAVVVLALAALGILAAVHGGGRRGASRVASLKGGEAGANMVLHGVDFREIRPGGETIHLRSGRASYAILRRDLVAEDVTVRLLEPSGEIVVKAPLASWSMDAGIVRLPQGGRAEGAGGWSASVPEARLDLSARAMTAGGASLSGPGVAVEGRGFVWRWNDGTMTMDSARARVLPGKAAPRRG